MAKDRKFQRWLALAVQEIRQRPFHGSPPLRLDEDAISEAVVAVLEQRQNGKLSPATPHHLENHLRLTALWRTFDAWRRRQRQATVPLSLELETPPPSPVEDDRWSEKDRQAVRHGVKKLSRPFQKLVKLYYGKSMTDKQIGIDLYRRTATATDSALGQRVFRQRQKMLTQLQRFLKDEGLSVDSQKV